MYLAVLGTAQELSPDDINRITKARELTSSQALNFMLITKWYDKLVGGTLRPGCMAMLMGERRKPVVKVEEMQEKIWGAFKKEIGV